MSMGPQRPVSGDGALTQVMSTIPPNEVFIKDSSGSMKGTGMLMLDDGSLLAPEGFGIESGSFITMADVSSIPMVNSINNQTGNISLTIPAQQIQSDWNQNLTASLDYIKNKPNLPTVPTKISQLTNDSGYLTGVSYPVTSVNAKTGAITLTSSDIAEGTNLYFTSARVLSYLNNNGYRKCETFTGTTDASGNMTITFANTYTTPPDVQPQLIGNTPNQTVRIVSVSNTGCVIQASTRNTVTLLSTEVLLGATIPYVGANVTVQITPRT